jgi:monoamine oxidase
VGISRRSVLAAAIGAAGLGLAAGCTRSEPASGGPSRTVDVVVVGAGASGLSAARSLVDAGASVVILEARNRVGGRLLKQDTIDGGWVDLGAQWVGPTQTTALGLIKQFGLQTFDWVPQTDPQAATSVIWGGSRWVSKGDLDQVYAGGPSTITSADLKDLDQVLGKFRALSKTVPPDAPWNAPQAKDLDSITLQTWLDQNTTSPYARRFF